MFSLEFHVNHYSCTQGVAALETNIRFVQYTKISFRVICYSTGTGKCFLLLTYEIDLVYNSLFRSYEASVRETTDRISEEYNIFVCALQPFEPFSVNSSNYREQGHKNISN